MRSTENSLVANVKNKRSMNLEYEILQLCFDILEKEITPLEAQEEILRLLDVVGQSEQYCEHAVTDQKTLRCTCCEECGEILDVLD